ncbi:MAG: HNH endonuclease [Pseudomonadota bacterium]
MELFENLANVWQQFGRQPSYGDIEKSNGTSKFSVGTYEKRYGGWNKALESFVEFINNTTTPPPPLRASGKQQPQRADNSARTQRKINWRLRATILIRDNCICQMCGTSPSKDPETTLHVDHIQPYSKGGETLIDNLQTLCSRCNIGKSNVIF